MPQLMPLFWVNSIFMILFVFMVLIFLYYWKMMEFMETLVNMEKNKLSLLW